MSNDKEALEACLSVLEEAVNADILMEGTELYEEAVSAIILTGETLERTKPVERGLLLWICRYALTDGELSDELRNYLDITDEEMISIADRVFLETEGELTDE